MFFGCENSTIFLEGGGKVGDLAHGYFFVGREGHLFSNFSLTGFSSDISKCYSFLSLLDASSPPCC